MGEDIYTEVTNRSWFGRIGSSLKGILFGFILLAVSVGLLFWNEGRTVKVYKNLKEGAGAVIEVANNPVSPANDGRLVHITGLAATTETLHDRQFPVEAKGLSLRRNVKMYQWKENKKSEKRKKIGGGEETVTRYSYSKTWSSSLISSSGFKKREGHVNPDRMPFTGDKITAGNVSVGAFQLTRSQTGRINAYEKLVAESMSGLPGTGRSISLSDGGYYIGDDENSPRIGDMIVSFEYVPDTKITLVAMQRGNSFEPYPTKVGGKIDEVAVGIYTAAEMFEKLQSSNTMLCWGLRLVGFIAMFIGFCMIFKPLSVLADLIPFVGSIVGFGAGIIAFVLTLITSVIVVAIAWIFYRPVLAVALLVIVFGASFLILKAKRGRTEPAVFGAGAGQKTETVPSGGDAFAFDNEADSDSKKRKIDDPFLIEEK